MSKNVFANGREISAKKDGNQTIAAMPDVCLSPPSPPAGPVPIPYPNTAQASDTSDGSKTVNIGGAEVGIKDSSNYKKSTGDEAATKSLGMGVNTATLSDKLKHAAWSFDVKIEGENAIRHMDLTTGNHINTPTSADTGMNAASQAAGAAPPTNCQELAKLNEAERNKVPNDKLNAERTHKKSGGGWALTSAVKTATNGAKRVVNAISDPDLMPAMDDSYSEAKKCQKGEIPACAGLKNNEGQPKKWSRRGVDSEARILGPEMAKIPPAISGIMMKVWHVHSEAGSTPDALPCWSCKEAICGAENCGIKITLCNNKNEPVKAETLCKKGNGPEPAGGTNAEKDVHWAKAGLGPL
jgi:hypothetical protein